VFDTIFATVPPEIRELRVRADDNFLTIALRKIDIAARLRFGKRSHRVYYDLVGDRHRAKDVVSSASFSVPSRPRAKWVSPPIRLQREAETQTCEEK